MLAKMRKDRFSISLLLVAFHLLFLIHFAEAKDLYKILGVEKNASHRDIQKAFHKLSLKYHPDKNPSKNAEGKFAEINNAYEVLSDDEKRKNYDFFGDEQGRPRGSDAADAHNGGYYDYDKKGNHGGSQGWSQGGSHGWRQGDSNGWSHFSYSSNDDDGYRFEQSQHGFGGGDGSYDEGDRFSFPFGSNFQGQKRSSFSFGGNESPFENLFNSFFGTARGKSEQQRFTSYTTGKTGKKEKAGYREGYESSDLSEQLNPKSFANRVLGQLYTWTILCTPHVSWELRERLELLEAISESLHGSIKVGYINCEKYHEFCKEYKMWPLKTSKLLVFSLRRNGKLGALDYTGKWSEKDVKSYCVDALPNFSMHVESIESLNAEIEDVESSSVVLLTQKKAASAMWRALSGLFHERIHFFDLQIKDYDTIAKMFRVDSFPAIIGVYQNGESKVLADGIMLDQTNPSVDDLKTVLEEFEKKSKAAGTKKRKTKESIDVIHLTKKNMRKICGEETPLCVIGAYKSSKGMEKVKQILEEISHKTLTRRGQSSGALKNPISFCIVDGTRQSTFLSSFHHSVSKENGVSLIAYKPKKGTFVSYDGVLTLENVENFVVEVLNGNLHFNKVSRDPVLV